MARGIPDARVREDALKALVEQRPHIDGAALFSGLPRTRNLSLLRLLVAYEIIWDFLDNVNERSAGSGVASGLRLHLALVEALDLTRSVSDYYRHIPQYDDGGYLNALVRACRRYCADLRSYPKVRSALVQEAIRGQVCALNHDTDPTSREARLKAWADAESQGKAQTSWFELTGAASTNLTVFALLALASEPTFFSADVARTSLAYFPWISVLTAMLDSYADQFDDADSGHHSYLAHYGSHEIAMRRLTALIGGCLREAGTLDRGERHMVIAGCMLAVYLSKDSALTPALQEGTRRLVDAGGSLTRLLHPILRLWRRAYGLRSA